MFICLLELILRTLVNLFQHHHSHLLSVNNAVTLPQARSYPSLPKIISLPFGVVEYIYQTKCMFVTMVAANVSVFVVVSRLVIVSTMIFNINIIFL